MAVKRLHITEEEWEGDAPSQGELLHILKDDQEEQVRKAQLEEKLANDELEEDSKEKPTGVEE